MSNGKGTISCFYCKHYSRDWWCGLYGFALPADLVGTDDPICADFAESKDSSVQFGMPGQLAKLAPKMRRGFLYGFPYPSHTPAEDLREICQLSSYAA
jgi:hypothetical protein